MTSSEQITNTDEKIQALRKILKEKQLAAFIIPSSDPHQSEYVPPCWRRRAFMSSFTGSAGDLVVTLESSGLWTDSRYFLQAEAALQDSEIVLFKSGTGGTPEIGEWLAANLSQGDVIGVDAELLSRNAYTKLSNVLNAAGIKIQNLETNPVDTIWKDRPPIPTGLAVPHLEAYAGESLVQRLVRVREKMASAKTDVLLVTTLDSLAWVFNIRGTDVDYTPVAIGYGAVERDTAYLFIDPAKVTPLLRSHLSQLVEIKPYEEFTTYLREVSGTEKRVSVDPDTVSRRVVDLLQKNCALQFGRNPITILKAVKNPIETAGMIRAHIRDGAAMVRFLAWLNTAVPSFSVTELTASRQLETFRQEGDLYKGPSFATISAFGAHGAIVHYEPSPKTDCVLGPNGIYLIDSGGQYLDGTTDITRTVSIGPPTPAHKDRFTRVLKGHIDLASTSFPAGTTGNRLDTIARKPLWDAGLNYGHGTGHGVGAYLCVHEGPQAVSYYRGLDVPLVEGMIVSIEPGYYKADDFGIRIENLVRVIRNEELSGDEETYLKFDTLTLCPIDLGLIERSLLTQFEIAYLNTYHRRVRETLLPHVDEASRQWLEEATREI